MFLIFARYGLHVWLVIAEERHPVRKSYFYLHSISAILMFLYCPRWEHKSEYNSRERAFKNNLIFTIFRTQTTRKKERPLKNMPLDECRGNENLLVREKDAHRMTVIKGIRILIKDSYSFRILKTTETNGKFLN